MVKKSIIKIFVIISIIASTLVIGNYMISKPISYRKHLLTDVNTTPANSAFVDENFYECVMDNFNSSKGTNFSYTYELNDEQLNLIESLTCTDSREIRNTAGIEKLTKIRYLSISGNSVSSIDLSSNLRLKEVYLYGNNLTSIDVSHNRFLETLDIHSNNISSLDLSNNEELLQLNINNTKINNVNLDNNKKIVIADLSNCEINNVSIDKNNKLETLLINNNNLTSIDLSNNTLLNYLYINNNKLSSIDLTNNTNLENLALNNNNFNTTQYLYINDEKELDPVVKLPSSISWNTPTYTTADDIVSINGNSIKALKEGTTKVNASLTNKYLVTYNINSIKLHSNEYLINEEDNSIYIGIDKQKNVLDKLSTNNNLQIEYDHDNNKIYIKNNTELIKEFKLEGIISNKYIVTDNKIEIEDQEISYDSFISDLRNIEVTYKIYDQDNEITSGSVKSGMKLKVFKNNELFKTYEITSKIAEELLVNTNNTSKNTSSIIKVISILIFVIGLLITLLTLNQNKNKEDNI